MVSTPVARRMDWKEESYAQVYCCCGLRLVGCNIGASDDACAASSAERYDDTSCCRLRSGQNTSKRRVRGPDYRPPDPPSRPEMCAMASGRLRFIRVNVSELAWRRRRLTEEHHNRFAMPLTQSMRSLDLLAGRADATPSS
jgi:hypothetical protein